LALVAQIDLINEWEFIIKMVKVARLEFIVMDFVAIVNLDFTKTINKPFTKFDNMKLIFDFNKKESELVTIASFKESFNTWVAKITVNSGWFIKFMVFMLIKYHIIRNL